MHPIRVFRTTGFRLALLHVGLFALSVAVLFGVIYWITDDALRAQVVSSVTDEVAALTEGTPDVAQMAREIEQRISSGARAPYYYLLLDASGRPGAGNMSALPPVPGWRSLPVPEGPRKLSEGDHRLLALGVALPGGAYLLVGGDLHRIIEAKEAIVQAFGWALGATLLLGALGGGLLSLGFLRRIDAMNQTTRAIIDGRLSDRVPTRGTGDELDSLAINLNQMLDSVQALMESLRQVSNDIAHDLRTPLTRLRQRLEDIQGRARSVEDYRTAIDKAVVDTDSILGTFAALLRIAQIEAGTRRAAFSSVDLSDLFESIAAAYVAVAEDYGQTLTAHVEPGIDILGDRELLTQMLANLVENAIRHTPAGASIELGLRRDAGRPVGIVADSGLGIPPEAREKVFQRFYRLDPSRSTAGAGLGLALVAAVAEIHGIAVDLSDNAPGLKVTLTFAAATFVSPSGQASRAPP